MSKIKREPTGNKYNSYKIRLSQLVTTYGPGGIVDFADQPLMVADVKQWTSYNHIHDERLESILGVDGFRLCKDDAENNGKGVPFVRFPRWYYCPNCKTFKTLDEWQTDYKKGEEFMRIPKCSNPKCGNVNLIAPSILVACEKGHIDDFPWEEWTHIHEGKKCNKPKLKVVSGSGSLGLESFIVKCECGAKNSLEEAFNQDVFKKSHKIRDSYRDVFKCKGTLQWKGLQKEDCDLYPKAVLRNASNIYFPKIETSIVIPPYSDELNTLIENSDEYKALLSSKEKQEKKGKLERFIKEDLEDYIESIAEEINKINNLDLIDSIVKRKICKDNNQITRDRNSYRFEEYNALTGKIEQESFDTRDFKIDPISGDKYKINEISKVTLVKRLREVRALTGFTRLSPPDNYVMGNEVPKQDNNIVDVKPNDENWYPAYEVRGEGIFIEIDSVAIDNWLEKNEKALDRANKLNENYNKEKSDETKREISPKFIMLHTLSHLLIKELSFECGYSITSLRERLYCDIPGEKDIMNGILIYTADSDSEGSLGGLVKQGRTDILPKIFRNAIKRAKWCSYDPVCINSNGQGRKSQNLAACHSCTLLPETSCEEFNILLDRALIVGDLNSNSSLGFLSSYI
ncbi:DrmB family protein [Terrisporobacter petrolearius]|uniref:DrmB family protein n=1 Tax=Terrisporobacter petrolearius TaxID=1460447 RepID=UPI003AFFEB2D